MCVVRPASFEAAATNKEPVNMFQRVLDGSAERLYSVI